MSSDRESATGSRGSRTDLGALTDVTVNGNRLYPSEVAVLDAALEQLDVDDLPETVSDPVTGASVERDTAAEGAHMVRTLLRSPHEARPRTGRDRDGIREDASVDADVSERER